MRGLSRLSAGLWLAVGLLGKPSNVPCLPRAVLGALEGGWYLEVCSCGSWPQSANLVVYVCNDTVALQGGHYLFLRLIYCHSEYWKLGQANSFRSVTAAPWLSPSHSVVSM